MEGRVVASSVSEGSEREYSAQVAAIALLLGKLEESTVPRLAALTQWYCSCLTHYQQIEGRVVAGSVSEGSEREFSAQVAAVALLLEKEAFTVHRLQIVFFEGL